MVDADVDVDVLVVVAVLVLVLDDVEVDVELMQLHNAGQFVSRASLSKILSQSVPSKMAHVADGSG